MIKAKEIYFDVEGNIDKICITDRISSQEIKDLILSIGKFSNKEMVVVSPNGGRLHDLDYYFLCENSETNPYIVNIQMDGYIDRDCRKHLDNSITRNSVDSHIQRILQNLIEKVDHCEESLNNTLAEIENKFISLSSKVEKLSLISWISNFKSNVTSTPRYSMLIESKQKQGQPCPSPNTIVPSREVVTSVLGEFKSVSFEKEQDEAFSDFLKEVSFNNWLYSDAELMYFVKKMFIDLGLIDVFNINIGKLDRWLFEVYQNYNTVYFHNFKHAFMVTQMMYSLIWSGNLMEKLSSTEILTILTASISHDLNHPGFNNAYQINSTSVLAVQYNDQSPLENHHSAVALSILSRPECAIFSHLSAEQQRCIRSGLIKCILATDMSRHNEILNGFKAILSTFDWSSQSHRDLLMMILIKASDISNEARPLEVASKWIDCLFQEFFQQSDSEKEAGLPVAPFMDREKVTKPASQCGFIRFVIYPLFDSLAQLIPEYHTHLVMPVLHQLDYYSHLDNITNSKPKSRKSIVESLMKTQQHRRASQQCYKHYVIRNIESINILESKHDDNSPRKLST